MSDFLKDCGIDIEEIKEENIKSERKEYTEILTTCENLYKWCTGRYSFKNENSVQAAVTFLVMARKGWIQNLRPDEKEYDASVYNLINATLKLLSTKHPGKSAQQNENR